MASISQKPLMPSVSQTKNQKRTLSPKMRETINLLWNICFISNYSRHLY